MNASLRPHEALQKSLLDLKRAPVSGANDASTIAPAANPAADAVPAASLNTNDQGAARTVGSSPRDRDGSVDRAGLRDIVEQEAGQTVGIPSADHSADVVQATLSTVVERYVGQILGQAVGQTFGQTVGMASADHSADAGRSTRVLSTVVVIAIVTLGIVEFLLGRPGTKRVRQLDAMRPSQCRPDDFQPLALAPPPENPVQHDSAEASASKPFEEALDTIEEALAELAASRRRKPS